MKGGGSRDPPGPAAGAGGGARDGGGGSRGRKEYGRAGVWVFCVGGREFALGGVWGGDGEPVRDGDVRVLLGDGGGGGGECGERKRLKKSLRGYAILSIRSLSSDANASIEPRSLNPVRTTLPEEKIRAVPFSPR